eukprot:g18795.t1
MLALVRSTEGVSASRRGFENLALSDPKFSLCFASIFPGNLGALGVWADVEQRKEKKRHLDIKEIKGTLKRQESTHARITDKLAMQTQKQIKQKSCTSLVRRLCMESSAKSPEQQAGSLRKKSHAILVHPRQNGNNVLRYISNVPWQVDGEILPDFVLGETTCALYLSLKYHQLYPKHIVGRFAQIRHHFRLRVLLIHVDVSDPETNIQELTQLTVANQWVMICCWSHRELARYLETYKSYEKKSADTISGRQGAPGDQKAAFAHSVGLIKSVNKTDIGMLASQFGSLSSLCEASEEDILQCPGLGPKKAKRIHQAFHQPFVTSRSYKK